jgi:hypothetical protein
MIKYKVRYLERDYEWRDIPELCDTAKDAAVVAHILRYFNCIDDVSVERVEIEDG